MQINQSTDYRIEKGDLMDERKSVLQVKNLQTTFFTDSGEIPAVDHIDFQLKEGEILGIVGESGCGKSVTSLSIMGLVPSPPGKIVGGEILFNNRDLLKMSETQMRTCTWERYCNDISRADDIVKSAFYNWQSAN